MDTIVLRMLKCILHVPWFANNIAVSLELGWTGVAGVMVHSVLTAYASILSGVRRSARGRKSSPNLGRVGFCATHARTARAVYGRGECSVVVVGPSEVGAASLHPEPSRMLA